MPSTPREVFQALEQSALLAELARPLVHECNNFLNSLLLRIALLESEAPAEMRAELLRTRSEARALASLLQDWQRFSRPAVAAAGVDLNLQVREAAHELRGEPTRGGGQMELALSPEPLWLAASAPDVKRLCYLLMTFCLTPDDADSRLIRLRTQQAQGKIVLSLRCGGPACAWVKQFDEPQDGSGLAGHLVPAACRSLAQRLQAKILCTESAEGGTLAVEWPVAAGKLFPHGGTAVA